ncbi:hypothetical protein MMC12_004734, partial [Toensbergia leucococca]|nr:hypothetical protein [Toensbergia leucococca]
MANLTLRSLQIVNSLHSPLLNMQLLGLASLRISSFGGDMLWEGTPVVELFLTIKDQTLFTDFLLYTINVGYM